MTHIDEKLVRSTLHEYRIFHAEVLFREDATVDQFIDVIEKNNRSYMKCLYAYNKIDAITVPM
ncbi:MAG: GTP-binding protein, partial [Acidiferrobacteraceae bacterium]|nr:GTP-binding protein [Acidiferrobacteraceae bacterium]